MTSSSRADADKIAVVTVHGTGDTAASPDGGKWFQRGSAFSEALKQRLAARGVEADIVPVLWSGANSAAERERGAERLAATIRKIAPRYRGVHVLGHSHGGNVANEAALLLRWGRRRGRVEELVSSVTTIGTPFLNSRSGAIQSLGRLLFIGVCLASVPLYIVSTTLLLMWVLGITDPLQISEGLGALSDNGWLIFWACTFSVGIPLWFMLRLAIRAWRRTIRPRSDAAAHARVFAVWHSNDEAISFLQQIEGLPLEPFPLGSMFRGSRGFAITLGAIAVVLGALAPSLIMAVLARSNIEATWASPYWLWTTTLTMLFVAPLLFGAVYGLVRFIAVSAGEVVARPGLNSWIANVLRGIAFGKDSDQTIGQVNTRSHTHATREHVIDGELAQRMQVNAEAAATKLIERYRWALFTVGADTNGPLAQLATDAMTWSSLIHTTYFDQPEVVDLIADYIGDEAGAPGAATAAAAITTETSQPKPTAVPVRRSGVGALAAAFGLALVVGVGSLVWFQPALLRQERQHLPTTTAQAPGAIAAPEHLSVVFRDCESCPEMTALPGGAFLMGAAADDPGRRPWEGPQHEVTIPAFAISVHEVTFTQWDTCVSAGGCGAYTPPDRGWGRGSRPVMMTSWEDAQDYVRWLSQTTGRTYRLPSESEWEFAARGGAVTPYWWGREFRPELAPSGATSPVEDLTPNGFGLRGVSGNVGEWVEDCYVNNYTLAPTDGSAVTREDCGTRVVRGGSWRDGPSALRIPSRSRIRQAVRDGAIGFRVVTPVTATEPRIP